MNTDIVTGAGSLLSEASSFSLDGTAPLAPLEGGSTQRARKRYQFKGLLSEAQVAWMVRQLGLKPSEFQTVRPEAKLKPPARCSVPFSTFWGLYPKRDNPGAAAKAWKAQASDEATAMKILADVKRRTEGYDWKKDGGKYIPFAHSYLYGQRWLDEGLVGVGAKAGTKRTLM